MIEAERPKMDPIEKVLASIGRWHICVYFFLFLSRFPIAWHQFSIIFMAPNVNHSCINILPMFNEDDIDKVRKKCPTGCRFYEFDRQIFTETLQMTYGLVCDREQLNYITQMIFMFGLLLGSLVFGTLSDKCELMNVFYWYVVF